MSIPFNNEEFVKEIQRYEKDFYELKDCPWSLDERKEIIAGLKNKDISNLRNRGLSCLRNGYADEDLAVIRWIIALIDNNFDVKETTFSLLKDRDFEASKWRNCRPWNTVPFNDLERRTMPKDLCMFLTLDDYEKGNAVSDERTIFYCRLLATKAERNGDFEIAEQYHDFANNLTDDLFNEYYSEAMNLNIECWKYSRCSFYERFISMHKQFKERAIEILEPNVRHLCRSEEFFLTQQSMFGGISINFQRYFRNFYQGEIELLRRLKEAPKEQWYEILRSIHKVTETIMLRQTINIVESLVDKLVVTYDNGKRKYEWKN